MSSNFVEGVPNLVAWNHSENVQAYVWCKHENKYHLHGHDCGGLRASHCASNNGYSSYNLVLMGEMPPVLKKDLTRKVPKGPAAYGYAEEINKASLTPHVA